MTTFFFIIFAVFAIGIIYAIIDIKVGTTQKTALTTISGFKPAVTYGGGLTKAGVAIDPTSNKFAIINFGQTPKVFDFTQLVAVEVDKNGSSITKTSRGSQAAGAAGRFR